MIRTRLCLLVLIVMAAGCSKKKDAETPAPAPAQKDPNQAVVTVNGVSLSLGEVNTQLDQWYEQVYRQNEGRFTQSFFNQRKREQRREIIEEFVVQQLLDAEVEKRGIEVSPDEIDAALAEEIEPNMTMEVFVQDVAQNGHDPEDVVAELQRYTAYQKLYDQLCEGLLDVNESEIDQYYAKHKGSPPFTQPPQRHCRHILIDPNHLAPNEIPEIADQKARDKAQDLLRQLQEGGDFATLAQTYSACSSAAQGGDLGYFSPSDMVEPFNKVAFSLDVSEISHVVKTQYGYHIIQLLDKQPSVTLSLDEARDIVTEQLTEQKRSAILKAYVKTLREAAEIKYAEN